MKDPKKNYISIIMLALNVRLFVRCLEGIFWHITLRALRMVAERAKLRYLVLSNRGAVLMKVRFDPCFVCFAVWTLPPYSWIDYHLGIEAHSTWYQPWHDEHCTYSFLSLGSLQRQKIGTSVLLGDMCYWCLLLVLGKGVILPDSR